MAAQLLSTRAPRTRLLIAPGVLGAVRGASESESQRTVLRLQRAGAARAQPQQPSAPTEPGFPPCPDFPLAALGFLQQLASVKLQNASHGKTNSPRR